MISLLITLLVILLIFGICFYVVSITPLPQPFGVITHAVLAIILLLVLLSYVLPLTGHFTWISARSPGLQAGEG